jgi:hypothetical protein
MQFSKAKKFPKIHARKDAFWESFFAQRNSVKPKKFPTLPQKIFPAIPVGIL